MIDFSNIKLPIYSNKYGQGDYLELIDYLKEKISEFRLERRRAAKNAIMGSIALPLIVFYSEWYRRDYVGGKGSQQWENPLINKGICTKEAFSEIRTLLVKKVREQYDILANRHDLVDNNGQLLRSILCQGGLPIEYIIHGRENNSFFTLLHWIVSESLNNEAPSIGEIVNEFQIIALAVFVGVNWKFYIGIVNHLSLFIIAILRQKITTLIVIQLMPTLRYLIKVWI